jgi:hypothetical protein
MSRPSALAVFIRTLLPPKINPLAGPSRASLHVRRAAEGTNRPPNGFWPTVIQNLHFQESQQVGVDRFRLRGGRIPGQSRRAVRPCPVPVMQNCLGGRKLWRHVDGMMPVANSSAVSHWNAGPVTPGTTPGDRPCQRRARTDPISVYHCGPCRRYSDRSSVTVTGCPLASFAFVLAPTRTSLIAVSGAAIGLSPGTGRHPLLAAP